MGVLLKGPSEPAGVAQAAAVNHAFPGWRHVLAALGAAQVIELVEAAGLTGKGGAGFPTHRKMRYMLAQPGPKKYLILNGSEHEPGSFKDRYLLEHHAPTVLEGALILAYAVQATHVIIAINQASPICIQQLTGALLAAKAGGVDFAAIEVEVVAVPDIYIVGEESALLEVIEGRTPLPRRKPPYPIERGVYGAPTLIHNIETAAHLPVIVASGPAAYRALGRNNNGITLCTLGEEFVRPGVHEIPLGTPLREVLQQWGGGLSGGLPIKAVQPGGPSAGFLAAADFDLPLDAQVLREHGSALGCAAIRAFSVATCMVQEISTIMEFFAHGSCGQCPRCRMETNMLHTIVQRVLNGSGTAALLGQVDKLIELARGQGICTLIDMPVAPLKSGLRLFGDEFEAHLAGSCSLCATRTTAATSAHAH
jgi:NADH:ubiquinone oxidoreductase subunit F (NADH-binding)